MPPTVKLLDPTHIARGTVWNHWNIKNSRDSIHTLSEHVHILNQVLLRKSLSYGHASTMGALQDHDLPGLRACIQATTDNIGFVLLATVGSFVTWKFVYAYLLSPLRNIPGAPLARLTPFRAIYNRLPKRVPEAALADYYAYGDIYVSKPDTVTISHPKDVRAVLGAMDSWKIDVFSGLNDPILSNLVTFSHPQLASRRRRQISPFLNNQSYLAKMEAVIMKHGIQALMDKWDSSLGKTDDQASIEINYRNDTQLITFSIMSALAFGRDHTASDGSVIVDWISATAVYVGVSINFKALLIFPFSILIRSWLKQYREFVEYGEQSVAQRKEALAAKGQEQKPADMLQAFIDAEDPDSKVKMTSVEVQAESVGMQLAGSETTSASLTWSLHLLTLYPKVLQMAAEEVRAQFSSEHVISYSDCRNNLPYLESFIYETFRYAPITSGFMPRYSQRSMELQGHVLPPGTKVAFNLIALNNRLDLWDQPERFIADRFIGDEDAKKNIFAFSYGPRSCIGRNLAWVEIMTILANLLKNYNISLPEDSLYGPCNVDEDGIPRMMPSQCHIVFAPIHPDRDCRLRITRHIR